MKNNKENAEDLIAFKNLEKLIDSVRRGFNRYMLKNYGARYKNVLPKADIRRLGGMVIINDPVLDEELLDDFTAYIEFEWLPRNEAKFSKIISLWCHGIA